MSLSFRQFADEDIQNVIVAGALAEWTATGVDPVDGGVALWKDGAFRFVLPEERATRRKYAGGFREALSRGLHYLGLTVADLDGLSFASYGETRPIGVDHIIAHAPELAPLRDRITICPSHHELHALYGFRHSPFQNSLIAVFDNEGMIIGPQQSEAPFSNPMERCSYYVGGANGVDLLTRDFYGKDDISLGEMFRRFNYYCGFPSHQYSGKTMALAGYGDPKRFSSISTVRSLGGVAHIDLEACTEDPALSVAAFFEKHGVAVAPPRVPEQTFHQDHLDVAAFAQVELERFAIQRLAELLSATRMRSLVLVGGVAYNCRLVGLLERELGIPVFVPPSPGDQGICIGAAHAWLEVRGFREHVKASSYFGGTPGSLSQICAPASLYLRRVELGDQPQRFLAKLLIEGRVVALVEGPSECGRRALGHRSLLAYPTEATMLKLRQVKAREWYRPFGISLLSSLSSKCFDQQPDPFMLRATLLKPGTSPVLEQVMHVDRSIRAQLISESETSTLAETLRELERRGCEPVVINTSLNRAGEPLIETADEAFALFADAPGIDALVLGDERLALVRSE